MAEPQEKKIFKYKMTLYYQASIVYFIFFIIYAVIRGEFIEGPALIIKQDPVMYFFTFIIVVVIISLLYNLILNRHIEIYDRVIVFKKGSKKKEIHYDDIRYIRIFRERRYSKANPFRNIRISLKNKRRPITIRPYEYENTEKLIETIKNIQNNLGKKFNV